MMKCDCPDGDLYYYDDLCEGHRALYDEYMMEIAPEDYMSVSSWIKWMRDKGIAGA
jgi:hypothetical protein